MMMTIVVVILIIVIISTFPESNNFIQLEILHLSTDPETFDDKHFFDKCLEKHLKCSFQLVDSY